MENIQINSDNGRNHEVDSCRKLRMYVHHNNTRQWQSSVYLENSPENIENTIYSMFVTGHQTVFAHSLGLKDFHDLKHVAFLHFVRVIWIFGFKVNKNIFFVKIEVCEKRQIFTSKWKYNGKFVGRIKFLLSFLGILSVCLDILHDEWKCTK